MVLASSAVTHTFGLAQDGPPPPDRPMRVREGNPDLGLLMAPPVQDELKLTAAQRTKLEASGPTDDVLAVLDETQRNRFAQLKLQAQGAQAFLSEPLTEKLTITKEQREKLASLMPEGNRMFLPPEERAKLLTQALELRTEPQRKRYAELTGPTLQLDLMPPPSGGPGPGGNAGGGPGGEARKLVKEFDKDGDKRLNRAERDAAREKLKEERANGGGRRRMGPPAGEGEEASPGERVAPTDVQPATGDLYDSGVVRTLFFDFADSDWLKEVGDFYNTDVDVPATLTVDGKQYKDVGVSYRGASSFFTVGETQKRSLSVAIDHTDENQRLFGYKSLNLLNSHTDRSLLRSALYLTIAGKFIPTPKANFVRVVINGENWGVYTNAQQFDKTFVKEHFKSDGGARWKVPGSPQARGGLEYLGDDIEKYRSRFEIKSKDDEKSWRALIRLCKTLNETPIEELEEALAPILDIESTLWFLAIDNTFVNNDGYWIRSSDYHLYLDEKGVFHLVPHDSNETFSLGGGGGGGPRGPGGPGGGPGGPEREPGGGPGRDGPPGGRGPNAEALGQEGEPPPERRGRRGGGPGGARLGGPTLDPLIGLDDAAKPLRSRLLKVPGLQRRYLEHVRELATVWLEWDGQFGALVKEHHALIKSEVERDTKKLSPTEAFLGQLELSPAPPAGEQRRGGTLRDFAEQRRAFLLGHPAIKGL
jgi:spore coat protein CotH